MNRCPLGVALAFAFAPVVLSSGCSSTGGLAGANGDAGGARDASVADIDAAFEGDASADVAPTCAKKPTVDVAFHVEALERDGNVGYLAGATVVFTSCDPFRAVTNSLGATSVKVHDDLPFSPHISMPGYFDTVFAELAPKDDLQDVTDVSVALFATADSDLLPAYDPHQATLALVLTHMDSTTCNTVDGVTFAVQGHPEAIVHYMAPTWPADKSEVKGASAAAPYVFISGLHGGSSVSVAGTKAGCWVNAGHSGQTGLFELVDGAVTIGRVMIEEVD